jgi:hypothetical protein
VGGHVAGHYLSEGDKFVDAFFTGEINKYNLVVLIELGAAGGGHAGVNTFFVGEKGEAVAVAATHHDRDVVGADDLDTGNFFVLFYRGGTVLCVEIKD